MTVKELAEYLKLSEVMIYKLAQKGEIPASKIGSAWRFNQAEIDTWLLSRREKVWRLPEPAKSCLYAIINSLRETFGDEFTTAIVFGSYARGEASKDSDLDLLVVLKAMDDYWEAKKMIEDVVYANTFGNDVPLVIAPVLIDEKEYLTGSSPLLMNVRKEGRRAA